MPHPWPNPPYPIQLQSSVWFNDESFPAIAVTDSGADDNLINAGLVERAGISIVPIEKPKPI